MTASSFSPQWLTLREAADARARSTALEAQLLRWRARHAGTSCVIDLGTGTGANIRHLVPLFAAHGPQRWLAVDKDPALLARLPSRMEEWCVQRGCTWRSAADGGEFDVPARCEVHVLRADLIDQAAVRAAFGHGERLAQGNGMLVAASALLDLVSHDWLAALAARCAAAQAAVAFALTYDGRMALEPLHADDDWLREHVNRHQHGDKGFGVALGPAAAAAARAALGDRGYSVESARSDWLLAPEQASMQRELIDGWAAAALEVAPDARVRLQRWQAFRRAALEAGESRMRIGHEDLVAFPA